MKQLTKRKGLNQRLRSEIAYDREAGSIVLSTYQKAMEHFLEDKFDDAQKYADSATAQLSTHTLESGQERLWIKFLLLHCQAICSANKQDFSRAHSLLFEAIAAAPDNGASQALSEIINSSNATAVYCREGRHQDAVKLSKSVLEKIDSISLANRPSKSILIAIRLLFQGMFHLLKDRQLPKDLRDMILKAHSLSIVSNGTQHRLTRTIERCALGFNQETDKPIKKTITLQSQGKNLALSKSEIRNSRSGCGSRLQLTKKTSTLRTKHVVGRSHDVKIGGTTNTTETHRLRRADEHEAMDHHRNPFQSPLRKDKKDLFEIYSGERKKKLRSPLKKYKANDEPDEMKELERIKRIYQPAHSNNKIEYSFEPGLLQRTYKLEFLMVPVNKSLCLEEDKSRVVRNRDNHKSGHIETNSASLRIKKNTDAFLKVRNSTKGPSLLPKKNYRIGIKNKRNTQTPTLITLSSLEDVERFGDYDPHPTTHHRYPPTHHRAPVPQGECGLI